MVLWLCELQSVFSTVPQQDTSTVESRLFFQTLSLNSLMRAPWQRHMVRVCVALCAVVVHTTRYSTELHPLGARRVHCCVQNPSTSKHFRLRSVFVKTTHISISGVGRSHPAAPHSPGSCPEARPWRSTRTCSCRSVQSLSTSN